MNEEKLNGSETILDDETQLSKDGPKRISYVAKDLKSLLEFVAKVYAHLGHTTYHSNKAIATVHGLATNTIKIYLSAAQQYKLFEIKYGVGYKTTELFQRIHLWKNENEKRSAIIESLKSPETYQQLFKDYEYHVVPFDGVKNHFIRNFGLKDEVAVKAAQVFIDNLKEYDLLDSRGVLTSGLPSKPIVPVVEQAGEVSKDDANNAETQNNDATPPAKNPVPAIIPGNDYTANSKYQNHIWIPIHITKSETVVFAYPNKISENDIKIVEHQLAGILLRIRLENEEKEKEKGANSPV